MSQKPDLKVTEGSSGLRIEKLRKSYRKKLVIRDVSISLDRGEVVALLGPNGSGKTTSFYAIAGLIFPEAGTVTIDGQNVTTLPMYRRARLGIGYLPQEMSIFRGLSVEDNIMAVLDIAVKHSHRRRERLEELLSDFSIEHLRRAPALALSGGERRRVEIARCLAADPKYLLLDEPLNNLDIAASRSLMSRLKTLAAQQGRTIVIVLHDINYAAGYADHIVAMKAGRVETAGPPAEVVSEAFLRAVFGTDARVILEEKRPLVVV